MPPRYLLDGSLGLVFQVTEADGGKCDLERMVPCRDQVGPRLAVALAYAFSNERHTANRPAMARAADERLGEPGSFSGMGGAAEIGIARKFLEQGLSPLHFAALYAKYGQRRAQCKHCGSEGGPPGVAGGAACTVVAHGRFPGNAQRYGRPAV